MIKKCLFKILTIFLTFLLIIIFSDLIVSRFYNLKLYLPDEFARQYPFEGSIFAQKVFKQEEHKAGRFFQEGEYYINEKGYRGKNFSVHKTKDTIRIMIFGGSSVFDVGSGLGKDWPHKVEQLLKNKGFDNIEIINAGVPGLASFDSVGRLLAEGHLFEPDFVVLYNTYNDFRYFTFQKSLLRRFKPFTVDYRQEYLNGIDDFFCHRSKAYLLLRTLHFEKRIPLEDRFDRASVLADDITPHSLKQYKLNIQSFVDLARNINAIPILLTEARMISKDLKGDFDIQYSYGYLGMSYDAIENAFNQTDSIIKTVAQEKHAIFIDTKKTVSGEKINFIDVIHLSDVGGNVVAKLIADEIQKQLLKR